MSEKTRVPIHLEVSPTVRKRLERLVEVTEAESMTEVFRRALALYEVVLLEQRGGRRLLLEEKDGNTVELRIL